MQNNLNEQIDEKKRIKLFNFIRRKVSNDLDAEDILQDVLYFFVNAFRKEPIENITAWLYHVADNKVIDWYRKRKTISIEKLSVSNKIKNQDDYSPLRLEEILYDPNESPDELYIRSTLWTLLSEALDDLPAEQRDVFIMNELEDMSFKEISDLTNVPVNTLLSRKHYAVLYLREQLREIYNEFFNK
jgi:RNA polymerase sigma factor (sigma-70 family)